MTEPEIAIPMRAVRLVNGQLEEIDGAMILPTRVVGEVLGAAILELLSRSDASVSEPPKTPDVPAPGES